MTASTLNFDKENIIEIGASYEATIQLFDAPNLMEYSGISQVKTDAENNEIVFTPTINILSHDSFSFILPFSIWNNVNILPGNYRYDVLFYKSTNRFYAIRGSMILIRGITKII